LGTCAVCCGGVGHACAAPTSTTSDAVWGRVDSSGVRAPTTLHRPGNFPRASDGARGRIATATATACIAGRHGGRMGEELVIDAVHPTTSLHNGPPGGASMVDRAGVPSLTMLDGVVHTKYVVWFYYGQPWLPSVGVRWPRRCKAAQSPVHPMLLFQLPIFLVRFRWALAPPPPPSVLVPCRNLQVDAFCDEAEGRGPGGHVAHSHVACTPQRSAFPAHQFQRFAWTSHWSPAPRALPAPKELLDGSWRNRSDTLSSVSALHRLTGRQHTDLSSTLLTSPVQPLQKPSRAQGRLRPSSRRQTRHAPLPHVHVQEQ
jgi:hypothetical protein